MVVVAIREIILGHISVPLYEGIVQSGMGDSKWTAPRLTKSGINLNTPVEIHLSQRGAISNLRLQSLSSDSRTPVKVDPSLGDG